ncbi:hypothetical protein [Streptomyces sp. WM6378]|uniref:hypothetical protein n=1 Tax=Streptomyces sp. WM6378 TaxID=1415557 RepID=UPI0006B05E1B|nr:hypothetical protein [Streptomyces sp. WM6378]
MSDSGTSPRTYPQPPIELAGFVENYLYGCAPVAECGVCAALAEELAAARRDKEYSRAYDAAAEIRNHPHPARAPRAASRPALPRAEGGDGDVSGA